MRELSSGSLFALSRLSLEKCAVDRLCLLGLGRGWAEPQVLLGKDGDSDLGDSNTSPPFRKERKKALHASEVAN